MKKKVDDSVARLTLAILVWLSASTTLIAQETDYNPQGFNQPLGITRGTIAPIGDEAMYFSEEDRCNLAVNDWGWDRSDCAGIDQMLISMGPDIDTMVIDKPVTEGFVKLDDWTGDVSTQIDEITTSYKESMKEQSEKLGVTIEFVKWTVYPQVKKDLGVMYFAYMTRWDGDDLLNVSLTVFDRHGYVPIRIVPTEANLSGEQLNSIIEGVVASYKSNTGNAYAEFVEGDKVATYGALSVLAGVLGVKYGKLVSAGLIAVAIAFLKKGWIFLLVPLAWLTKYLKRK